MEAMSPILAHGFDFIATGFSGIGAFVVICAGAVVLWVGCDVIRNAFRFGREGIPLLAVVSMATLFSGAAYFLVGFGGLFTGVALLLAFAVGRRLPKKSREWQ